MLFGFGVLFVEFVCKVLLEEIDFGFFKLNLFIWVVGFYLFFNYAAYFYKNYLFNLIAQFLANFLRLYTLLALQPNIVE